MERKDVYLASKPRYEILDGLRGVAAVLVAYHLFETYYHGAPNQPINHGRLHLLPRHRFGIRSPETLRPAHPRMAER